MLNKLLMSYIPGDDQSQSADRESEGRWLKKTDIVHLL